MSITNAKLAAFINEMIDRNNSLWGGGTQEERDNLRLAAQRLEAREISEATVERAALAFAVTDGCGLTIDGDRVLCCDPRAGDDANPRAGCTCLVGTRAALEAAAAGE